MQDFVRDWRRWTMAERIIAGVIAAIVLGAPLVLAIGTELLKH